MFGGGRSQPHGGWELRREEVPAPVAYGAYTLRLELAVRLLGDQGSRVPDRPILCSLQAQLFQLATHVQSPSETAHPTSPPSSAFWRESCQAVGRR